ncbi:hypothetical protein ILUMI_25576 [Ignelater luminosus]|uniref:Heat shock protein 70 n=1 Tax=Ignelater luminosus TaxID=2038154 RepID=A0A8K0C4N0_IGNLU|nr:hypothetical protein ILUMI_25576 [Ignelater luminosus]
MADKTRKVAIGIDLGTTNSCVAVCKNGKVETIPHKMGGFLVPSWVTYTRKEVLVGDIAKAHGAAYVKSAIFAIKRIIGRKFNDPVVQSAIKTWKFNVLEDSTGVPRIELKHKGDLIRVSPEEISGLILRDLKESAEAYLDESEITDAVITVPAYFNDHQRQATIDAAKIAGLNVLRLINEPTAAAIAYIYDKPEKQKRNILVYDLGGGTFDVSIVNLNNANISVKAACGDTNLGGINFDDRCVEYFMNLIQNKYKVDMKEAHSLKYLMRLRNLVEKAKHDLSTIYETTIELIELHDELDVYEDFLRARFEDLNEDLFTKTLEIVKQCIKEAKLKKEDIDDVVLVGGSTRIPKIEEGLTELFGKAVSKAINQEHGVAHGAAILAANLTENLSKTFNISDVTAMSLGIETLNGEMNVLIKRNSQIPTQAQRTYTTGVEGENAIRITVLEGDSKIASKNLMLGTFDLLDLPLNPSVNVTFEVDCNGILTVHAVEDSTGINKMINVILNKGRLTSNEISLLRKKSYIIKKNNEECNKVKEKKNEFQTYLLKTKDQIKRSARRINTKDYEILLNKIEDGLSWLSTKEAEDVKKIENKYNGIHKYYDDILRNK